MTRLNYDQSDREIREALHQGMEDYKQNADERAMKVKHARAVAMNEHSKTLKRLRNNFLKRK